MKLVMTIKPAEKPQRWSVHVSLSWIIMAIHSIEGHAATKASSCTLAWSVWHVVSKHATLDKASKERPTLAFPGILVRIATLIGIGANSLFRCRFQRERLGIEPVQSRHCPFGRLHFSEQVPRQWATLVATSRPCLNQYCSSHFATKGSTASGCQS